MEGTLLQKYASDLVNNLIRKVYTLSDVEHNLSKGEIREIFVSDLLRHFLPEHLGIGTGIIINQASKQSKQTDIIIFDKRIFPPILGNQNIGLYPIESVVGVMEVKSSCNVFGLTKCQKDFEILDNTIQNSKYQYRDKDNIKVLKGFICFKPHGFNTKKFSSLEISEYSSLDTICIESKFTVTKYKKSWHFNDYNISEHEEIKGFICWFSDNLRLISNRRILDLSTKYRSWTSIYFRHQDYLNEYFKNIE
jgi:hypothetical protein